MIMWYQCFGAYKTPPDNQGPTAMVGSIAEAERLHAEGGITDATLERIREVFAMPEPAKKERNGNRAARRER